VVAAHITETASHTLDGLVDVSRLTQWLDANIPSLGSAPLKVQKVHGGTSNVILSLDRGGEVMMLRRPPAVPPPGSERSIAREARVLTALNGTPVPHPICYGHCVDTAVIGAPFYVMERVSGWAAEIRGDTIHHRAPFDEMPSEWGIPYAMVDGLIALANVDHEAVGLGDFGKPGNFLHRQVDRWESQLHSYRDLYRYEGREIPGYDYVRNWLRSNIPSDFKAGLMHGDVGTPNALFAFDRPARLIALIDWELCTIGDPLIDLAGFTNQLRDEDEPDMVAPGTLYAIGNMPTRQEMMRYYAAGTGRDMTNFHYYCALSLFKSSCILEYKVAQSAAGILSPETGRFFDRLVLGNMLKAERLLRRRG
jgi:aminoglycoside phosphotransferase (APT) family kinase protein